MEIPANASLILCIIAASFVSKVLGHHGRADRNDPNEKVFNVLRYGAHRGREDNAPSFIRAWKAACNYRGKARLLFPKGTFLIGATIFQGPCQGPAPIKVQIAGTLKAVPDPSTYEEDFWILFENINGLLVTGTGTVDGQGNAVWKYDVGDGGAKFPSSIKLNHVVNGIIRQITSMNPMGFRISIVLSQNTKAKNLAIFVEWSCLRSTISTDCRCEFILGSRVGSFGSGMFLSQPISSVARCGTCYGFGLPWEDLTGKPLLPLFFKILNDPKYLYVNFSFLFLGMLDCLNGWSRSPNTHGIHISKTNQVYVSSSVIGTGDGCIGIIRGCTDVHIRNVICGPGHGISIGSLGNYQDKDDVGGITVKNCTCNKTDDGIRIKTYGISPPSQASGIPFQDIVMDRVKNPIIIDQSYGNKESASRVKLSDVRYQNVRGTSTSVVGVNIKCSHPVPCERVSLSNINLNYVGAKQHNHEISSVCTNAKLNFAGFQQPSPCR
ncbi:PREDICTED: exopolygalacturonase clone GBGE184-like [Populus euphratica]|uniref:Exopolygalacturonase clone GBGE184-like n=1 Tax=Populus euphratica TaxID=75702 RepID=A0AAJ6TG49_POPEU|nr:PREDICTED: exopolygalacturonase clone GBGE184-like [Populus euphratica]